jgi:hypothetical protein
MCLPAGKQLKRKTASCDKRRSISLSYLWTQLPSAALSLDDKPTTIRAHSLCVGRPLQDVMSGKVRSYWFHNSYKLRGFIMSRQSS